MNAVESLSPGSPIARKLDNYETRPQQVEMVGAVGRAFANKAHLLVEAGTGVGKSFAYLLPAIERAVDHNERILISTRTIALQEQLVNKDIPFLQSVIEPKFTVELVKGRSNYLGLRRLTVASRKQNKLFTDESKRDELWRIEDWAVRTEDGSLSDMVDQPNAAIWERVRSESDNCMGRRCPTYDKCFFQRARRRTAQADILVVNHALFFSDLSLRIRGGSILPDYDAVVLDEAHTVEDAARSHFGMSVANTQIHNLLNTLHNKRTGRGVLASCGADRAVQAVAEAGRAVSVFYNELVAWQKRRGRNNGRLTAPLPMELVAADALRHLAATLRGVRSELDDENDRFELASQLERAEAFADQIEVLARQGDDDWVYWLEVGSSGGRRVALHGSPINVGETLAEELFARVPCVVLTSATLTAGRGSGFDYIRGRLGLETCDELQLGSPFDYESQMSVHVEANLPEPSQQDEFLPAACECIKKWVLRSGGGALVLFTSYSSLNECADRLESFFADAGIELLVHGRGMHRSAMLDKFRSDLGSVIFGTESFWEGVDVPGDALTTVIIVKLPFAAPDRPDVEARIEYIRKSGGDPFGSFQLPAAVLRFKQGVGRLIRSKRDSGVIVVLDRRVVHRPYGRAFLSAIPACPVVVDEGAGEPG